MGSVVVPLIVWILTVFVIAPALGVTALNGGLALVGAGIALGSWVAWNFLSSTLASFWSNRPEVVFGIQMLLTVILGAIASAKFGIHTILGWHPVVGVVIGSIANWVAFVLLGDIIDKVSPREKALIYAARGASWILAFGSIGMALASSPGFRGAVLLVAAFFGILVVLVSGDKNPIRGD
jgi:hypothetical protein